MTEAEMIAARAMQSVLDQDVAKLACITWYELGSKFQRSYVAIVDRDSFQAWWPSPHTTPPRVLWWTTNGTTLVSNVGSAIRVGAGIPMFGYFLDGHLAHVLTEHVLRPAPVVCSHCGAPPAADASSCRYCGSPVGGSK